MKVTIATLNKTFSFVTTVANDKNKWEHQSEAMELGVGDRRTFTGINCVVVTSGATPHKKKISRPHKTSVVMVGWIGLFASHVPGKIVWIDSLNLISTS